MLMCSPGFRTERPGRHAGRRICSAGREGPAPPGPPPRVPPPPGAGSPCVVSQVKSPNCVWHGCPCLRCCYTAADSSSWDSHLRCWVPATKPKDFQPPSPAAFPSLTSKGLSGLPVGGPNWLTTKASPALRHEVGARSWDPRPQRTLLVGAGLFPASRLSSATAEPPPSRPAAPPARRCRRTPGTYAVRRPRGPTWCSLQRRFSAHQKPRLSSAVWAARWTTMPGPLHFKSGDQGKGSPREFFFFPFLLCLSFQV